MANVVTASCGCLPAGLRHLPSWRAADAMRGDVAGGNNHNIAHESQLVEILLMRPILKAFVEPLANFWWYSCIV